MARVWRYISFALRFGASLLMVSVLSPAIDPPNGNPAFTTLVSSLEGYPSIVIWKSQYTLTLYKGDAPVKTYRAVFGRGYADGDKERTGDKRTPEGEFYVCSMNHSRRFYKFLGLSYPGLKHAQSGLRKGFITLQQYIDIEKAVTEKRQPPWDTALGGAVGIHGRVLGDPLGAGARRNWTDGCIALTNADMDELFSVVSIGTPVIILP
jgi:murein L,D-transpeptidase YafK